MALRSNCVVGCGCKSHLHLQLQILSFILSKKSLKLFWVQGLWNVSPSWHFLLDCFERLSRFRSRKVKWQNFVHQQARWKRQNRRGLQQAHGGLAKDRLRHPRYHRATPRQSRYRCDEASPRRRIRRSRDLEAWKLRRHSFEQTDLKITRRCWGSQKVSRVTYLAFNLLWGLNMTFRFVNYLVLGRQILKGHFKCPIYICLQKHSLLVLSSFSKSFL